MNKEMKFVDPRLVPAVHLATGDKIPVIGMGTFGSDNYGAEEIAQAVRMAIKMGYRHLDVLQFTATKKK